MGTAWIDLTGFGPREPSSCPQADPTGTAEFAAPDGSGLKEHHYWRRAELLLAVEPLSAPASASGLISVSAISVSN